MTTLRTLLWWRSLAESGLRHRRDRFAALLLASVSLAGCAVGPDFSAPAPPAEQTYLPEPATTPGSAGRDKLGQTVRLGATLRTDWWSQLGSPELDRTVALALSNNRTIDSARSNVARAGELVTAARGGLYPQLDAAAGLSGRQYGASFLGPEASTFPTFSAYTGGLTVGYDLDIFGGTHRKIELAAADAGVQGEALNATRLTVAGSTVVAALRYASIRGQIAAAIRVIVQLQRFSDGKRRVTSIAEITGLESDIIQMQEIFKFVRTSTGDDGKVEGHFQATGVRPRFLGDLVAQGISIPGSYFDPAKQL